MAELTVHIPKTHLEAVSYTFRCLFDEFLGVSVSLVGSDEHSDFVIRSERRSVSISNIFFRAKSKADLFDRKQGVPESVDDAPIKFAGKDFPILSVYGKSVLGTTDQDHVHLSTDIVGSTFFMLSRWEEAVIPEYDGHGRFDYRSALSVRMGFYQRPIVNEYVELLWELCLFLDPGLKRKERHYAPVLTSDIDQLRKWKNPKRLLESVYLHVTQGWWGRAFTDTANFFGSQLDPKKDYYNNLDYMSGQCVGLNAVFYLKTNYSHPKHDKNRYRLENYAKELQEVQKRGVRLGIHPHYNTCSNIAGLREEVEALRAFQKGPVDLVRQHFLRFSVPGTWRDQASMGLKEDSTMIYPHRGGFRNGVCHPFPVYDFEADQELGIYEAPLLLMETPYLPSGLDRLLSDAESILSAVRKYNGNFVFLWHNGNLVYDEDRRCFEKLIEMASRA